tara:strand:- start:290 stop:583 length:294 start_codon:yes stop_codon:yes gene_type:complete
MNKSPKSNTRWSKTERKTMLEKLATYSKPTLGFAETAQTLGRTPEAVSWQYYNSVKKYTKKKPIIPNVIKQASTLKLEFEISNIRIFDNKMIIEVKN